jgi:hypothetical protein
MNLKPRLSLGRGFFVKSGAVRLLESFADQPLKLLHLRGVSLHPV